MRFGNSIAWQITFRLLTNSLLCLFWKIQAKIIEKDTICFRWNRGFSWPFERGHFERKNNGIVFHESTCIYSHVKILFFPFNMVPPFNKDTWSWKASHQPARGKQYFENNVGFLRVPTVCKIHLPQCCSHSEKVENGVRGGGLACLIFLIGKILGRYPSLPISCCHTMPSVNWVGMKYLGTIVWDFNHRKCYKQQLACNIHSFFMSLQIDV